MFNQYIPFDSLFLLYRIVCTFIVKIDGLYYPVTLYNRPRNEFSCLGMLQMLCVNSGLLFYVCYVNASTDNLNTRFCA